MFERIGYAIDCLINDFRIMIYRTWFYRRVYSPCWVSVYFLIHPDALIKERLEILYGCDFITERQYKHYWDKLEKKWGE